jgi:hypothetical protein
MGYVSPSPLPSKTKPQTSGFVAADTLFSVLDNRPISSDSKQNLMFPLIQGLMAFDTPFNGLSRSMFAYGAFTQYQNITSIWNIFSSVSTSLPALIGSAAASSASTTAASTAATSASAVASSRKTSWKRWQLLAARTGTIGAIAAGGVAAYTYRETIMSGLKSINRENLSSINYKESLAKLPNIKYKENLEQGLAYVSRESIGEGFAWMAGHLTFVGALMKQTQLTTRLERLSQLEGVGLLDVYTSLGENGYWSGGYFVPKRTFCAIPAGKGEEGKARLFVEQRMEKAGNEIEAHCSMFRPEKNKGYEEMLAVSCGYVGEWVKNDPRKMKDEYKPSREQLHRSKSESQTWDDDGFVLTPGEKEGEGEKDDGDEDQLEAILKSRDMPQPEDGGVDDEELQMALQAPLPADEEAVKNGELESAAKVPLPGEDDRYKEIFDGI